MKEAELRAVAECALCQRPFGHTGLPLFWRVTIERFGVNVQAVRRQDALAQMLGSSVIASVMGVDEDMATPMMDPIKITVCETCAMDQYGVAMMAEIGKPEEVPA